MLRVFFSFTHQRDITPNVSPRALELQRELAAIFVSGIQRNQSSSTRSSLFGIFGPRFTMTPYALFWPKRKVKRKTTQPAASPWRWKLQELVKQICGRDVGKPPGQGRGGRRKRPASATTQASGAQCFAYLQELCELLGVDLACSLGRL